MSRSATTTYHHGDLRRALIEAGSALLDEQSVSALSLRSVAREAGVSHAAPYHHFRDRSDLLKALGDACMADFTADQQAAADAALEPRERLVALGAAYVGFAHRRPHAFALIFDPVLCPPGSPSPERAVLIETCEALLRDCVDAALGERIAAGADAAALADAMWASVHGLATLVGEGHLPYAAVEPALRAVV